jgi:hypothetical protein
MTKKRNFFVLVSVIICAALCSGQPKGDILTDGLTLSGVDGQLISKDNSSRGPQTPYSAFGEPHIYYFKTDTELADDKTVVKAGTAIEVLPSVALEKMAAVRKENPSVGFRIWGTVTSYRGENYIFVIYFLQLGDTDAEKTDSQQSRLKEDPNDPLRLPPEILEKMKSRKIIQPTQLINGLEMEQDRILVDRTGFIKNDPNGNYVLSFDAIGRNLENISIPLLPCYMLESSSQEQKRELEEIRFNVSGVVTKYKGSFYLLLQRASRVYGHGNFTR